MKNPVKNISFTGLRARLILLVLIVIVPMLGLIIYNGIENRNTGRIEVSDKARRLARNASTLLEDTIVRGRDMFFALSQLPRFRQQDPDACSKILADLLKRTESYSGFAAAKTNGEVFASAPTNTKPVNFADRPWFQRLVQTRGFVISDYLIGHVSGKPAVVVGYPVLDHTGRLVTVLSAGLDLERLQQSLLKINLPDGATLTVIDINGTILSRVPDPEKFVGKKILNKSMVKTILTKKEGVIEEVDLDGLPSLYGYASVGSGVDTLHISVGIPEQVAYAKLKRHMIRDFTLLGLVSVLALLSAWVFGKILIMSPVNRLIGVTKRLAEGDLTVRTGRPADTGELGLLALHFDQMAGSLQHREEERKLAKETLLESERRLSEIIDFLPDATFAIDGEGKVIMWNHEIEEMTGVKAEYMLGKGNYEYSLPFYGTRRLILIDLVFETYEEIEKKYRFIEKKGDVLFTEADVPLNNQNRVLWGKARPLYDSRGNVSGAIESIRDITERKLAEEALRANEEKYRNHFDNVSDIILSYDREFRILSISPSLERVLGYKPEEFIGKSFAELNILSPEYLEKAFSDTIRVFAGEHLDL
ncbi:MAG: PAS domain S-box protein, partial [Candidatus Omnitrophota bacterium]